MILVMINGEFRETLASLDLTQADFGRILQYLSGQPADRGTINRWATGRRAVPPTVVAILRLWGMLPETRRRQILDAAPPLADRSSWSISKTRDPSGLADRRRATGTRIGSGPKPMEVSSCPEPLEPAAAQAPLPRSPKTP